MTEWKIISTAPRNGDPILAVGDEDWRNAKYIQCHCPQVVYWNKRTNEWMDWLDGCCTCLEPVYWTEIPKTPGEYNEN